MTIVPATGAILEQLLDESYAVWGEGLTRDDYGRWNAAQMRTAWGQQHLERIVLVDRGRVLSSMKRYRFAGRLDGCNVSVLGIGAVFTPLPARGKGYAADMIEAVLEQETARGTALALLFSEIGEEYYRRCGFATVPMDTLTLGVDVKRGGAPAMLVRAGEDRDLSAIAEMNAAGAARARFALVRGPDLIRFQLTRRRLLAGFSPPGLRQLEFYVTEEGGTAVAYVVLSVQGQTWVIEEWGDRDPAGARLGAMLQVLLARDPTHLHPLIQAWLPARPLPPQLHVAAREAAFERMMIRPLAARLDPRLDPTDVIYWHADVF